MIENSFLTFSPTRKCVGFSYYSYHRNRAVACKYNDVSWEKPDVQDMEE